MAIKSKLATSDVQAAPGNYSVGRSGESVSKITIHHAVMAKASARQIANVFTNPSRYASANYCVGYTRGDICCSLYEENRAWTSSSGWNDRKAITIEAANSSISYPYPVSDDTLANLIDLCVDICQRYHFRLNWTGDQNGSLTVHRMFASTACPGDYLMGKMQYIADEVNKRLDNDPTPAPTPGKRSIGDVVNINGVYVSSTSTERLNPAVTTGTITKIVEGARNPYLLNDGNIGWVNDDCIVGSTPKPKEYETYKVVAGDCLSVIGARFGVNWKDIAALNGIGYPYTIYVGQVLKIREKTSTPTPAPVPAPKPSHFNKGDTVTVSGVGKASSAGLGASTRNFSGVRAKVIAYKEGAPYPYALNCNNNMNGVTGWFKASSVK